MESMGILISGSLKKPHKVFAHYRRILFSFLKDALLSAVCPTYVRTSVSDSLVAKVESRAFHETWIPDNYYERIGQSLNSLRILFLLSSHYFYNFYFNNKYLRTLVQVRRFLLRQSAHFSTIWVNLFSIFSRELCAFWLECSCTLFCLHNPRSTFSPIGPLRLSFTLAAPFFALPQAPRWLCYTLYRRVCYNSIYFQNMYSEFPIIVST